MELAMMENKKKTTKKRNMKKGILLMAYLVTLIAPTFAQEKSDIKVASFNLRMNTPNDGENAWPHRKEMVAQLIAYHDLDVIGTQEAYKEMLDDVIELNKEYAYVGKGRDDGESAGEHSAILYKTGKYKLIENGDFWYSETPDIPAKGWDADCCNRICSWAKLKEIKSGKEFYLFSSHFDHRGVVARKESSKLMLQKIKEIAGPLPIFAVGDFNATPDSEPIQTILADGLLMDSYATSETKPYGPQGTFSSFKLSAPMVNRIDYIFTNEAITINKYAVLTDLNDGRFPSDHFPVVVNAQF